MTVIDAVASTDHQTNKQVHTGVVCDNCDAVVKGIRYKCLICPDYDLCEVCERSALHAEHQMMRMVIPGTVS